MSTPVGLDPFAAPTTNHAWTSDGNVWYMLDDEDIPHPTLPHPHLATWKDKTTNKLWAYPPTARLDSLPTELAVHVRKMRAGLAKKIDGPREGWGARAADSECGDDTDREGSGNAGDEGTAYGEPHCHAGAQDRSLGLDDDGDVDHYKDNWMAGEGSSRACGWGTREPGFNDIDSDGDWEMREQRFRDYQDRERRGGEDVAAHALVRLVDSVEDDDVVLSLPADSPPNSGWEAREEGFEEWEAHEAATFPLSSLGYYMSPPPAPRLRPRELDSPTSGWGAREVVNPDEYEDGHFEGDDTVPGFIPLPDSPNHSEFGEDYFPSNVLGIVSPVPVGIAHPATLIEDLEDHIKDYLSADHALSNDAPRNNSTLNNDAVLPASTRIGSPKGTHLLRRSQKGKGKRIRSCSPYNSQGRKVPRLTPPRNVPMGERIAMWAAGAEGASRLELGDAPAGAALSMAWGNLDVDAQLSAEADESYSVRSVASPAPRRQLTTRSEPLPLPRSSLPPGSSTTGDYPSDTPFWPLSAASTAILTPPLPGGTMAGMREWARRNREDVGDALIAGLNEDINVLNPGYAADLGDDIRGFLEGSLFQLPEAADAADQYKIDGAN